MAVGEGVVAADKAEALAASLRGWTDTEAHPFRRYFARQVDILTAGVGMLFLLAFGVWALVGQEADAQALSEDPSDPAGGLALAVGFLAVAAAIPVNAVTIGLTGGSLGKWVFGIKVVGADGRPIGVPRALVRELGVWAIGLGFGLPVLSFATGVFSLVRLANQGQTDWDRWGRITLLHRPWGPLQTVIGAMVVLFLACLALLLSFAVGQAI